MVRCGELTAPPSQWITRLPMTFPEHHVPASVETSGYPRVRVQSLGSGSSGNAFLIEHGESSFLLDCGVGIRTIARAMKDRQRAIADLDAILITHEHIDHVRTLPRVLGSGVPVIASPGTFNATRIPDQQWLPVESSSPVEIAGASIRALTVRHDAADPCGFLVEFPTATITILTDLGSWQENLLEPLLASDLIVLEANHDTEMLRRGPYAPHLKRRVASAVGHLSNKDCGGMLAELAKTGTRSPEVWLAHLSQTNNRSELAKRTVDAALNRIDRELRVTPLPRRAPGPIWTPSITPAPAICRAGPVSPPTTQLSFDGF